MEPIIVLAAGAILVVTGIVNPDLKDKKTLTEVYNTMVSTPAPETAEKPEPDPVPEPELTSILILLVFIDPHLTPSVPKLPVPLLGGLKLPPDVNTNLLRVGVCMLGLDPEPLYPPKCKFKLDPLAGPSGQNPHTL